MAKINIGKMACESCGNLVTVKENENTTLSYRCDECDAAPYARPDTNQNKIWRNRLKAPIPAVEVPPVEVKPTSKPPAVKPVAIQPIKTDMWGNPV